jgi:hypothetical protein
MVKIQNAYKKVFRASPENYILCASIFSPALARVYSRN